MINDRVACTRINFLVALFVAIHNYELASRHLHAYSRISLPQMKVSFIKMLAKQNKTPTDT